MGKEFNSRSLSVQSPSSTLANAAISKKSTLQTVDLSKESWRALEFGNKYCWLSLQWSAWSWGYCYLHTLFSSLQGSSSWRWKEPANSYIPIQWEKVRPSLKTWTDNALRQWLKINRANSWQQPRIPWCVVRSPVNRRCGALLKPCLWCRQFNNNHPLGRVFYAKIIARWWFSVNSDCLHEH